MKHHETRCLAHRIGSSLNRFGPSTDRFGPSTDRFGPSTEGGNWNLGVL